MPTPPLTGTRAGWFVLPMAVAGLAFSGISFAEAPPARSDSNAPTDEELDEVIEHTRQEDLKDPDGTEPDESWFDSTPEHEAAEPQPDDRKPDARRAPAPPEG